MVVRDDVVERRTKSSPGGARLYRALSTCAGLQLLAAGSGEEERLLTEKRPKRAKRKGEKRGRDDGLRA